MAETETKTPEPKTLPFRVTPVEKPEEVIKGFTDMESAKMDAKVRNDRAVAWQITTRYQAIPKP